MINRHILASKKEHSSRLIRPPTEILENRVVFQMPPSDQRNNILSEDQGSSKKEEEKTTKGKRRFIEFGSEKPHLFLCFLPLCSFLCTLLLFSLLFPVSSLLLPDLESFYQSLIRLFSSDSSFFLIVFFASSQIKEKRQR